MNQTRWAVYGTGYIAGEFAKGMRVVADGSIISVCAHSKEHGDQFAQVYGIPAVYTDFGQMLKEEQPDVVYIAIPNHLHFGYIMEALELGIPVLSEKPTVDNHVQLEKVLTKAKEKNVFFMEGMWTRLFPVVKQVRSWIADGEIGNPQTVTAAFDIKPDPASWQTWKGTRKSAAGALRDVGIYSLGIANMVFPEAPESVHSFYHSNGEVDDVSRLFLDYGEGRVAYAGAAFNQIGTNQVDVVGTGGRISFGPELWHPSVATLTKNDGTIESFEDDYPETGFQYEIKAVQECLQKGLQECPEYGWDEMILIADIIETERKKWGIFYDSDC